MVKIIDGKAIALSIREDLAKEVAALKKDKGLVPKLVVILVGEDPASQVYVRNKEKACEKAGILGETKRLPAKTSQNELESLIKTLNKDKSVHGILVQLPLPKGLDPIAALNVINPAKDVDGLHPLNMGKLLRGEDPLFSACTPSGIMELILSTGQEIKGKNAVVVGRSNIVGKPMAIMLLAKHATVTICHSRTKNLPEITKNADILVASVGSTHIIQGNMVKNGAIVIDVGMNRLNGKLVGDVEFDTAKEVAGYITPVPGGVGPMTIAMLLKNTLISAKRASV